MIREWEIPFGYDQSIEQHTLLTRVTRYEIHFHRKLVSLHFTQILKTLCDCTKIQPLPPNIRQEKTICGQGSLTYLSTKPVCFIHIWGSRFRFNHFTSKCRRTQRKTKKCTKINRSRHGHEARDARIYDMQSDAKTKTNGANTNEFSHFPFLLSTTTIAITTTASDDVCNEVDCVHKITKIQNHHRFASDVNLYFWFPCYTHVRVQNSMSSLCRSG